MTRQEAIKKAVGAHGQWKARLRTAIDTGTSDYTAEGVAKDNACEFGKWLYSNPALKIETPAEYEKVRKLHAEFHQEVGKVLSLALSGKAKEALKAFDNNTPFTKLSADLTMEMMNWSKV